jgi:hypothetical protein
MIIDIKQYDILQSALKVQIEIIQYNINVSAVVNVNFLDIEGKRISNVLCYVDGTDFSDAWITDDNLIDICLNKLGLSRS